MKLKIGVFFVEFTIILLALVAAFLGLRLYSVLGKRTGNEQDFGNGLEKSTIPMGPKPVPQALDSAPQAAPSPNIIEPSAEDGLRAMMSLDRNFSVVQFVENAKSAYRMILEAYWEGDKDSLKELTDSSVYASFAEAIDARELAGETLENRLVRIDDARIIEARLEGKEAEIALRFDADIAALVRDKDGNVIGGSLSDAVETHDEWVFARNMTEGSPMWVLVSTHLD